MKIPLIWLKDYIDTDKSAKELAISFTQLGLMLDKPIDDKNVLDLEHRMDRSDWLSLLGCARDLAAYENIPLRLPKGYLKAGKKLAQQSRLPIQVKTPAVRRFTTRIFQGIKVAQSPQWLIDRLESYGLASINNIVDITNFVMVEYAQPMHAQDLAKLKGRDITIRNAKPGEHLTTLLGTELKLDQDAFVLTSGGEPTVIGGIVGGQNTGVTDSTTEIILDAGNYDSRVIRKVSRKLKIFNETVSRSDKFLDPRTIDHALGRATALILELAGGEYYDNSDYYPSPVKPQTMTLRYARLATLSGMDIPVTKVKSTLKALEYAIVEEGSGTLTVEVPYFRTDIEVEDDLISDILRINNYQNIPPQSLSSPIPLDLTTPIYRFEDKLRDLLIAQGGHEHITNSLTSDLGKPGQIKLANALTTEQNALRTDLHAGLSRVISSYTKHKSPYHFVFEIGKVFELSQDKYLENRHLTALFPTPKASADSLSTLLSSLGITSYHISNAHQIMLGDHLLGSLNHRTYTLLTDSLLKYDKPYTGIVADFTHESTLDLSLLADPKLSYASILAVINSLKGSWSKLECLEFTKLSLHNNYLLRLTWKADNPNIHTDKTNILTALQSRLNITSTS